jgi:hypothetical protein
VRQTFDQYCDELRAEAARIGEEAEMRARCEHLRAFNFGRSVQRLEDCHHHFWLRVCWLLLGLAMGSALVAACLQSFGSGP